jgi:cellulose synthase/poly-beta-1,6-N-acetylglucosamine synthase-like glycosyltransferase
MKGNWISNYRSFSYSYGQHVLRRVQSALKSITVFPGPVTCFNTDIIKHLDFDTGGLTEDFDLTLQVHRYKLGKILFIPEAVNYTQDPLTLKDFIKQNQRWLRGFFQGIVKYKIGRRFQPIDFYIAWQMFEATFYLVEMLILLPILAITTHSLRIPLILFVADYLVLCIFAVISAIAAKRWSIIKSLPYYYILRWIEISIFVTSYVEVVMLHRYRTKITGWNVQGRRYALDDKALQEVVR